jgi:hypothetical protein
MVPEKTPCQIEKTSARITSETFVNAVSTVYLRCNGDFDQFCSLLNLKADKYGQEKWRLFNELIERINSFDMPTLTRIIEMGSPNAEEPVPGKSESD